MAKRLLVSGTAGPIGSEVCRHFGELGFELHRIEQGGPDLRQRDATVEYVRDVKPYGIVHAAEQPWREGQPPRAFDDFDLNTAGTLNLLEGARRYAPESPFIHISSRRVYGDRPNTIPMRETPTRFDFAEPGYAEGIAEGFPVDNSTHTPSGITRLAADLFVQEYSRYFHLPACCLRVGDVAGASASSDGNLDAIIEANLADRDYIIHGHKGKQVRDIIDAGDVARFVHAFYERPRWGELYNLGGGKANSYSLLEACRMVEKLTGQPMHQIYHEKHRTGDTICYYSDLRVAKSHFPSWTITKTLQQIVATLVESHRNRPASK